MPSIYQVSLILHLRFVQYSQLARIENPLKGIPKETLMAQVRAFATEHRLSNEVDVFIKGVLVAQSPIDYENISELHENDRAALRREDAHKWHQPKALWFTIAVCSIGAAVQGWDQAARLEPTEQTFRSPLPLVLDHKALMINGLLG
ncbi:hypothetical protein NUU61_000571 [Penicillium alfredii]|uniref:Uncharacterized protein n=1 Tax=Penicillium alfredii TaxID=1506179 RepID=A0A9W9KR08_9EURO|nr:uncharacterized protein NUU61_000571 [Penicillium alfredii]KAJ5114812.1 hypothetical protein NUU61_000571 [Penicillium alfredii]